jgi:hypothetical protein
MKIVDDQTPTPFFPFAASSFPQPQYPLATGVPKTNIPDRSAGIRDLVEKSAKESQQANPQGVTAPDRPGAAKVNSMASRIALRTPLSPTQSWYFGKTRKSGQRVVPGRRRLGLILGRSRR